MPCNRTLLFVHHSILPPLSTLCCFHSCIAHSHFYLSLSSFFSILTAPFPASLFAFLSTIPSYTESLLFLYTSILHRHSILSPFSYLVSPFPLTSIHFRHTFSFLPGSVLFYPILI
jgi:hypothetical protein